MPKQGLTLQNIKTLVETVEKKTPGHLTEKIFQNALVQEIRGTGLSCNQVRDVPCTYTPDLILFTSRILNKRMEYLLQEVVLPVIYKGAFVGYNRLDILVMSGNPTTPHITIIEVYVMSFIIV